MTFNMVHENWREMDNYKYTRLHLAKRRMGKIYDVVKSPNVSGKI